MNTFELIMVLEDFTCWLYLQVQQLTVKMAVFCRNILFYYSSGITIGILGSLLIVVFMVSRFIPKVSQDKHYGLELFLNMFA